PPDVPAPGHSHDLRLKVDAVNLVGDAFKNAPVSNPDNKSGIKLHLDLGAFQGANDYIISNTGLGLGLEGGDSVRERAALFYCTVEANCVFPNQPGVIDFMLGLPILKHAVVNPVACNANPAQCKIYFSLYRGFVFHYLVIAHDLFARGSQISPGKYFT